MQLYPRTFTSIIPILSSMTEVIITNNFRGGRAIITVPEAKSSKRACSISVGPSDVETVGPDELDQEDASMGDTTNSKVAPATKAEALTSKKSATSVPKEGNDSLSYREVLKILDEANKLVGHAAKIPHTVDGLQRMDCAIRTHLSQITIRISVEIAKYDAVFDEYNRIRQVMETRTEGTYE
ncbi:hypothetical protein B0H13DRAFT_2336317 [Mycena leptocephala]|nr:hypothetical protein B0H13DRAFT_2336317 [Mycena leptocephala]